MSRPGHPILCSVMMAARSTSVSWSMQPSGRSNSEGGGEGEEGAEEEEEAAAAAEEGYRR